MTKRNSTMPAPRILGVAEVVLNVRDIASLRSFYQEVLGFRLFSEASHRTGAIPDQEGEPTICFLAIQQTDTPLGRSGLHPQLLVLIDCEQHVFAKNRFDGHDVRRSTLNHLAFEIASVDFENHLDHLRTSGHEPTLTEFPQMRARAMFFQDPEGNTIELICHSPSL